MGRRPLSIPLAVFLGSRRVGVLLREPSGALSFRYEAEWLSLPGALPVSLSLPLREDPWRGEAVTAVFENLLPDSDQLRRRVAGRVGARGTDAFSLLSRIGQDCVGALRFVPVPAGTAIAPHAEATTSDQVKLTAVNAPSPALPADLRGEELDEAGIENILLRLARAPLGLDPDDPFRISMAGAQEKTALLRLGGRWFRPHGDTPTTHILKPAIGSLSNGLDLSASVENEFYCLKLARAFGLDVADAEILRFGETPALVIRRFDRRWTGDAVGEGRLLRLPQEDCCQALGVPPTLKYESEGGPGMAAILDLLRASDRPAEDQKQFLAAALFFWVIGATDGHAKNFSLMLGAGGRFRLAPFYDILSAEPSFAEGQITRRQMRLAMAAGKRRHYRLDEMVPRHFAETARGAGVPTPVMSAAMDQLLTRAGGAFEAVEQMLEADFPRAIPASICAAALPRLKALATFHESVGA